MTLKTLRYEKGMTQKQLANSIGVSRQIIAYAEKGGPSKCSPELVCKICGFFGVTPTEFLPVGNLLKFKPKSKDEAKMLINKIKEEYGL